MFCFRHFHGLVTDLVRVEPGCATSAVRTRTCSVRLPILDQFLFGSERAPLAMYLPILREVQEARCFYCQREVKTNEERAHVDHFVPWSRYPVDLGHNFVLAHGSCNLAKADHLAATEHLARWSARNRMAGARSSTNGSPKPRSSTTKKARAVLPVGLISRQPRCER